MLAYIANMLALNQDAGIMPPMNDKPEPTGKAKGGLARMRSLSPEQRTKQASEAALKRWSKPPVLNVTHGSPEHPLKIGDLEIDCYVLEGDVRVVTQRSMLRALGLTRGGARDEVREGEKGGAELPRFATQVWIKDHITKDLAVALSSPVVFRSPGIGVAYGYPATILVDICETVLAARDAGATGPRQIGIVKQADVLVRGLARVGIEALVDEATGFQRDRAKDALAKILETFIAKELQAWVQTFPADFYEQMFRLRGLPFPSSSVKRPQYFGILTNDIVYKRLAPGVLSELKRVTPRDESGRRTAKYFQSLTTNAGYPKLKEHLGAVIAYMRISKSWDQFMGILNEQYPRFGDTVMLPMDYDQGTDNGRGI